MTPNEYQLECERTVMSAEQQMMRMDRLIAKNPKLSHVIVGALKLNSESGELADSIVKHVCYGQPLDELNILEECGDLLWYISLILSNLNFNMEDCMKLNIEKLKKRYPEKFSEFHAKERLDKK